MEPTTIMMGISALGAGMGVLGEVSSGISQRRQAEYNRQLAEYNAEQSRQQALAVRAAGRMAAQQKEAEGRRLLSTQEALYAEAGVDTGSGSPLTVRAETAGNIQRDILITQYNYEVKARQMESQADIWEFKGAQEEDRGESAFWGGLLGGAVKAFKGAADIWGASKGWGSDGRGGRDAYGLGAKYY